MTEILQSIRPEWCEKIFSGKKTVEVRKTRPAVNPPFRVFVYETAEACGRYGKPLYAEELELLTELRHAPRTEPEHPAEGQIGFDEIEEDEE